MSVRGLGARQQRGGLPIMFMASGLCLLIAIVLGALTLIQFSVTSAQLQTNIRVGGVPVGGLPLAQAVKTWEAIYAQPVEIDYGSSPILLDPAQVGFSVNSDQLRSQVQSRAAGSGNYWTDFINYLLQRPAVPVDIPLAADYQQAKLRAFLNDVAARYQQNASGAHFDLSTMTFGSGQSGAQIDIDSAMTAIDKALFSPTNRKVALPIKTQGAQHETMDDLHTALLNYLKNFTYLGNPGLAINGPTTAVGVVVINLKTGEEMSINPDVAFSAESTIKLPVMLTRFRQATAEFDLDTKWLLAAMMICSSDSATNYLIQSVGTGNNKKDQLMDGLNHIVSSDKDLGAPNTFISAPLYVQDPSLVFSIPQPKTNVSKIVNAHPDYFSQTTPTDMATLLKQLYDCAQYGSGLRAIDPQGFTQKKCQQMIELMSGNVIGRLSELGIPAGTRDAHKNGWGGTTKDGANVSDAALIFTPGGDYVFSTYIWEQYTVSADGIGSIDTWDAVEGMSRVVYNYFNPDKPLTTARTPQNPLTAIDCVMPNPQHEERVSFDDVRSGRFNPDGTLVADACVNYPACQAAKLPDPIVPATPSPVPST